MKRKRPGLLHKKPPYIIGMFIVVILLLLGLAGLVLPILQGILLLTLGVLLYMEYHEIPWLEKRRDAYIKRYEEWKQARRRRKIQRTAKRR